MPARYARIPGRILAEADVRLAHRIAATRLTGEFYAAGLKRLFADLVVPLRTLVAPWTRIRIPVFVAVP